jgi:PhnB protein
MDKVNAPGVEGGVIPYINVESAAEASAFYQKAFGATELFRLPFEDGKRLMHCHLHINGGSLMMSDCYAEMGMELQKSHSYTMHLQVDDVDAWWQRAVDAGVEVLMPLELMFWGDRYGRVRDPFGVHWSLASTPKAG